MKHIALLLCMMASAIGQQPPAYPIPIEKTYPAQLTFKVTTDNGEPVPNVEIGASTFLRWQPGESFGQDIHQQFSATTDVDGVAVVRAESKRGDFGYRVKDTPGFYRDNGNSYNFKEVREGRWQPANLVINIVLKPVIKPVPLYARKVGDGRPVKIPTLNKPVGFDLMIGDWVTPHGKGNTSDLTFTLTESVAYIEGTKPFDYVLTVTFSNEGDGIQSVLAAPHKDSELRLPRQAPENGYEPKLEKQMALFAEGEAMKYDIREDQNYFFRVRTVLDEKGQIKSALYGKIMGNVRFGVNRSVRFTYYLNPESLDRNMEFDRTRNLFDHLSSLESVSEP